MKKYIKFLIVFLMVVAAVTFTCYMFFNKLNNSKASKVSLTDFAQNEEKVNFAEDLNYTISNVNHDGTDNRLQVAYNTVNFLDSSVKFLSTYYTENDGVIENEEIAKQVNITNNYMYLASDMMKEIEIKSFTRDEEGNKITRNIYYNVHVGANDLYVCLADYIVNYSTLIRMINENTSSINKQTDIRFTTIDFYTNIAINTFSKVITSEGLKCVEISDNIFIVNTYVKWDGLSLKLESDMFSEDVLNFIKYYNLCNKDELAKNIYNICNNLTGVEEPTNEQKAAIYFKGVFGVR